MSDGYDPLPPLRDACRDQPESVDARFDLARELVGEIFRASDDERRTALLGELRELTAAYPYEPRLRERLANALKSVAFTAQRKAERKRFLGELEALTEAHPHEPRLREFLAGTLHNLHEFEGDDETQARAWLDQLRDLSRANPDEARLRDLYTGALVDCASLAKIVRKDEVLAELRALAEQHSNEERTLSAIGSVLFGRTNSEGLSDAQVERRVEELHEFAEAHPDLPVIKGIIETLAGGNAAHQRKRPDRVAPAGSAYEAAPNDQQVIVAFADALWEEIDRAGELKPVLGLVQEFRELAARHAEHAQVRAVWARCLSRLPSRTGSKKQSRAFSAELKALHKAWPDDVAVLECYASDLAFGQRVMREAVPQAVVGKLAQWCEAFPKSPKLRRTHAYSLVTQLESGATEGDARDLLGELRALAQAFPDEPGPRGALARALCHQWQQAPSEEERAAHLAEFKALVERYPDDVELRTNLAMALALWGDPVGSGSAKIEAGIAELRAMSERYQNKFDRMNLADVLLRESQYASDPALSERRRAELIALSEAHPDDPLTRAMRMRLDMPHPAGEEL